MDKKNAEAIAETIDHLKAERDRLIALSAKYEDALMEIINIAPFSMKHLADVAKQALAGKE